MVEVLVGAGGWSYFNIPGDRLRNYATAFKTVEVNFTYYTIPPISLVRSWRSRVPNDFEFTVRCNRELIQELEQNSINSSLDIFERMEKICQILKARVLHILITKKSIIDNELIDNIDKFLSSANYSNLQLAWEIRGIANNQYQRIFNVLKKPPSGS